MVVGLNNFVIRKLLALKRGETLKVAMDNEDDAIVGIVEVVWVTIVRVQPTIVIVVFNIEDVEIAVGVSIV